MSSHSTAEVVIVGGGIAGLSASLYTARAGLDTLVVDEGDSILRRNAHLENYPGFPAGINPRKLLDLTVEQAEEAGIERQQGRVVSVDSTDDGFVVEPAEKATIETEYVIAATKNTVDYLTGIDGVGIVDRGKSFVDADERGRTGVDGLYVAGRMAEKAHQAIVCAGHGAEVAVTLLEEADTPFYHDWVAPEGYFTDRGLGLPPACEEIDESEREAREKRSCEVLRDRFSEPHYSEQPTHPSLQDE